MASKYDSLYERLVANTAEPENDQACWCWTGRLSNKGYGRVNVWLDGRLVTRLAHRLMFDIVHRPAREVWIDDVLVLEPAEPLEYDETVDHICETTTCINPDHLRLLSRAANTSRMRQSVSRVPILRTIPPPTL